MKKTYQNPEMEVIKIATAQMLAASVEGFATDLNNTGGSGSGALSREEYFNWFDE